MSFRTKCNFCNLQSLKKRYGEDRLIIQKITPGMKSQWHEGWTEVSLKERNGDERFLAVFVRLTNQCVC